MSEIFNNRYLTRRAASKHLNEKGVPVKVSTINKSRMDGDGPVPDLYYGRQELFLPETVERWAEEHLLSRKPRRLDANGRQKEKTAT
jgi:hypothetical protein